MRSGYILLEIVISIALGSVIGVVVFASFFQINKTYKTASRLIGIDSKASLLEHQMERDLSGAFIPFILESLKETTTTTKVTVKTKEKTETTKFEQKKEELKEAPLEKAFHAQMKDNDSFLLSFVTSNPLTVYDGAKPRVVRVVYRLVPNSVRPAGQQSFKLIRKEVKELNFSSQPRDEAQGKKVRSYELVDGIKNMSFEFIVRPVKKEQKQKEGAETDKKETASKKEEEKKTEEKKKEIPYETFQVWGEDQIKKVNRNLPNFVNVTVSFWDRPGKTEKTFIFKMPIFSDDLPPIKIKKLKKKQEQKKKEQPDKVKKVACVRRRGFSRRPPAPIKLAFGRGNRRRVRG